MSMARLTEALRSVQADVRRIRLLKHLWIAYTLSCELRLTGVSWTLKTMLDDLSR